MACAAAIAGMDLLASNEIQEAIECISRRHKQFEESVKEHPMVKRTRSLGVIFALDLQLETERYGNLRDRLYRFFMEQGVFLRPLGNTIYLLPPFTIADEELTRLYESIRKCLEMLYND
jgi:adenosylmethionine-8-amino-7-oxononanoate aminotransferase